MTTANLLLHTLFSRVDCKLNGTLVTANVDTYPYKAYLETILSHGGASLKSWLQAELYEEDDPCNNDYDPTARNAQPGIKKRNERIKESRIFQLTGQPHVDIFMQDKISTARRRHRSEIHKIPNTVPPTRRSRPQKSTSRNHRRPVTRKKRQSQSRREPGTHRRASERHPCHISSEAGRRHDFCRPSRYSVLQTEKTSSSGNCPGEFSWDWSPTPLSTAAVEKTRFNFRHFSLNYLTLSSNDQTFPHEAPLTPYLSRRVQICRSLEPCCTKP